MSISCAPTLESTSYISSIVPSWLGVTGTCSIWLIKTPGWDNNKLQAARGCSSELNNFSWLRYFTVRVTECGPSRETTQYHRCWRLRTSCCFTIDWKSVEREARWIFGQLHQTMASRHDYVINGIIFDSGVLDCDCRGNFVKIGKEFSFS